MIRDQLEEVNRSLKEYSPQIMTGLGAVGVGATAWFTAKATWRLREIYEERYDYEPEWFEVARDYWHLYIPAVTSAGVTILCIVGAQRINSNRLAGVTAAYAFSESTFRQYKDRVVKEMGEKKEGEMRADLAQEKLDGTPPTALVIGDAEILCYDAVSMRPFKSTWADLQNYRNQINHSCHIHDWASLDEWYDLVGLRRTKMSGEVGWKSDKLLELDISAIMTEDKRPAFHIDFNYLQPV